MGKDSIAPAKSGRPINFNAHRLKALQMRQQELLRELKTVNLQIQVCNTLAQHLDTENIETCYYQLSTLTEYFIHLQAFLRPFSPQQR